jgi:hypothetical protein
MGGIGATHARVLPSFLTLPHVILSYPHVILSYPRVILSYPRVILSVCEEASEGHNHALDPRSTPSTVLPVSRTGVYKKGKRGKK